MSEHHIIQPDTAVDKEAWHLSKSVPLAFVLTLLVQTVVLVSWAATFKAEFVSFKDEAYRQFTDIRTYVNEKTNDRITGREVESELKARDSRIQSIERRDEQVFEEIKRIHLLLNSRLERIEGKIDRYVENSKK